MLHTIHAHCAGIFLRDTKTKVQVEGCSNQWRFLTKRSDDDSGSNRGSATVANAGMGGISSTYAEDMYKLWLKDKASVHSSWNNYFTNITTGSTAGSVTDKGIKKNMSPLDKGRLVRYIQPKEQQGATVKTKELQLRKDNQPIKITIDITNSSASDQGSLRSEEVKSVKSNPSLKSVKSTHVPSSKSKAEPTPISKPKPIPRLIHPPQSRELPLPSIKKEEGTKTVTWEERVKHFKRMYLQPTIRDNVKPQLLDIPYTPEKTTTPALPQKPQSRKSAVFEAKMIEKDKTTSLKQLPQITPAQKIQRTYTKVDLNPKFSEKQTPKTQTLSSNQSSPQEAAPTDQKIDRSSSRISISSQSSEKSQTSQIPPFKENIQRTSSKISVKSQDLQSVTENARVQHKAKSGGSVKVRKPVEPAKDVAKFQGLINNKIPPQNVPMGRKSNPSKIETNRPFVAEDPKTKGPEATKPLPPKIEPKNKNSPFYLKTTTNTTSPYKNTMNTPPIATKDAKGQSSNTSIYSQSPNGPPTGSNISNTFKTSMNMRAASGGGGGGADNKVTIKQHLAVQGVIRSYQTRGHLKAYLDPLGILNKGKKTLEQRKGLPCETIMRQHKALSGIDPNTKFTLPDTTFIGQGEDTLPLKDIIERLEKAYCNSIGVECMYIQDLDKVLWIREQLESPKLMELDKKTKIKTLQRILRAVYFESFLAKKYSGEKRFGLEGSDVMIACIKTIMDAGAEMGLEAVNIAMAHRGRMNVLANICQKSLKDIFTTFDTSLESADESSGDIKYHLGTVATSENSASKKNMRIAVLANPSHLEPVGPVCLGKTRCEQFMNGDKDGTKILGLTIHGDAAFCGQGIVFESIHTTYLPNYTCHGSIHLVCNNQVGFTTDPRFSRSSPYPTDVGRVVLAPIFHVNSDDPDAVIAVSRMASQWRQKYHEDVVIDLVGYRRNGHQEQDEPMFTQPLMYQIIKKHPNIAKIYSEQLIKEGVVTQADVDEYIKKYQDLMEADFSAASKETKIHYRDWLDSPWKGFFKNYKYTSMPNTGISEDVVQHIAKVFSSPPPGDFVVHRGITRILKNRAKLVDQRMTDWALGEALAYGSLMKDGYHVRLSGQDVERSTFGHRHHILHHQTKDMETYNMLADLYPNQAPYVVCNSSLSEYAILGFELGYSQVSPHILDIWEGQYGDFCNVAQVMFDQFISSGQSKWYKQCGLVCSLPHGIEGGGPEHSSSRIERFLQMCDDDVVKKGPFDDKFVLNQHENCNWFITNCSTPASIFHVLRRQMLLPFRKPLMQMSPKGVLRYPAARSSFDEFLDGKQFMRVIPDMGPASKAPDEVKKLIFCSGHTYYNIIEWIAEAKLDGQIAVSRTEQLSPFPYDLVAKEIGKYKNAKVFWAQEEHKNQGGWTYMQERINGSVEDKITCAYNGRSPASAPATGNKQMHLAEVAAYKKEILQI